MAGRGFRVTMAVPEIQQALDQISIYDTKSALRVEQAIATSTKAIGAGAKQRVSVHTGKLKKKISTRFENKGATGVVSAKTPYAHLIEFGAKSAVERPKTKKVLKLYSPGAIFFSKIAHIPARAPRPFMRPAFEDEKPNLISELEKAVQP